MYMMCGLSGCGKTSYAKEFSKDNNLFYLGIDEFYEWYNGDECIRDNTFEVWIEFYQAIHRAEQNGVDIIIDIDAPTFVDRTQMLDWFPGFDEYHLICKTAPERLRRANNSSRTRRVPEDEMDRMLERFEYPRSEFEDARWNTILVINNNDNVLADFILERMQEEVED
jgi:predicted kinase